jgi:hypothetical protein
MVMEFSLICFPVEVRRGAETFSAGRGRVLNTLEIFLLRQLSRVFADELASRSKRSARTLGRKTFFAKSFR